MVFSLKFIPQMFVLLSIIHYICTVFEKHI
nr:MAG TPA: hypothetical protein [Caudoviricetes sp.]